jgi:hypothetical protein
MPARVRRGICFRTTRRTARPEHAGPGEEAVNREAPRADAGRSAGGPLTPSRLLRVFHRIASNVTSFPNPSEHSGYVSRGVFISVHELPGCTAFLLPLCYHRIASQGVRQLVLNSASVLRCTAFKVTRQAYLRASSARLGLGSWASQPQRSSISGSRSKRSFLRRMRFPTSVRV